MGDMIRPRALMRSQPTMDVEAAIRDDKLDFGIFGGKDRLRDGLAERMIEEIRQEMRQLGEMEQ